MYYIKKIAILILAVILTVAVLIGCAPSGSSETTDPLESASETRSDITQTSSGIASIFELNENGYFSQSFSKTIDFDEPVEYSDFVMLFYINLDDETKAKADSYAKADMVFESSSLTFYPNGKVRLSYKLLDEFYSTFSERELWSAIVPQQSETVLDYMVDLDHNEIMLSDGSVYTINQSDESITRAFVLANEVYSKTGELVGSQPTGVPAKDQVNNFRVMKDIQFDSEISDEIAKMDVYIPDNLDTNKSNGAIFTIYGGGWTSGNKDGMKSMADIYAQTGYLAVTMNLNNAYHNEQTGVTEVTVFDMLNDLQACVEKLKELSYENGWNITQIAMVGSSSGGNLALTYAYSRGTDVPYFNTEEVLPVRFVADLVGPVDMHESAWYGDEEWEDRDAMTVPGAGPLYAALLTGSCNNPDMTKEEQEAYLNAMSPVWYVDNGYSVPTVMGYSLQDFIQNPNNGKLLKRYLDQKSIRNDLFTFPNSVHSYANDPEEGQAFIDKSIEYAETYFVED